MIRINRRYLLAALAVAPLAAVYTQRTADAAVDIDWDDLLSSDVLAKDLAMFRKLGVVEHDQLPEKLQKIANGEVTQSYNGQTVRIRGYMVPLGFNQNGVTSFILAPFIGACIHVPAPPPNQLILVAAKRPQEFRGLEIPVEVTGPFTSTPTVTALADVGYSMNAAAVEMLL